MREGSKVQSANFFLILMVLFNSTLGCNGQKNAAMTDTDKEESTNDSPLTLLVQGNYAPNENPETLVITGQKDLTAFFRKINMTRKPGIPTPTIDFTRETVLIYCAGINGNGTRPGLIIAKETDAELILGMDNYKGKEKSSTSVSPFVVYTLPSSSKKISFKAMQ